MNSEALWAAVGTLGGLILREIFRAKRAEHLEAAILRKELRQEIERLSSEMKTISHDLDLWKQKFYDLAAENLVLKEKCKFLEFEIDKLKGK